MTERTVLVIEDNPISLKLFCRTLANAGLTVLAADDAAHALDLARSNTPDLILQDLLLPDMDGFELVRLLRAEPALVGTPIVAVSGFLSQLQYGRAAAAGFSDFLAKPVVPSRLLEVVRQHLPPDVPAGGQSGGGRRLLIVDDDGLQLKLCEICFSELGFEVTTAADGERALELLRTGRTEIVLSDVLMPRVDGFQLCAEMRRDETLADIPIILASSNYVEPADRALAVSMGATAFVERRPDLAAAIEAVSGALRAVPTQLAPSLHPNPGDYHDRVVHQLERQAGMNAALAQRASVQAAMLSVIAGVTDALTSQQNINQCLPDILASLLEAAGLTRGALLLNNAFVASDTRVADDGLMLATSVGFSEETLQQLQSFCKRPETLAQGADRGTPLVIRRAANDTAAALELLSSAGAQSMLLVPLTAERDYLGVLLLASTDGELTEHEWLPFARTMAMQIGQALALNRAFSRVAAAENRYSVLMRGAHDGIAVLDGDGGILEINPELEKLLGRNRSELVGASIWSLIAPDDLTASQADFALLIQSGTIRSEGRRLSRPDGRIVVTDISASVSTLNERRVVLAVIRDVTERTRARAQVELLQSLALAASEAADLPTAFDVVLGTLCHAANWTFGAAWLPRATPKLLQCSRVFARTPLRFTRLTDVQFAESEGVLGRVWASRKPQWVRDLASEPDCPRSPVAAALHIRAGLVVPVLVGDELIAILEFFSSDGREQDEQYVKLVSTAAAQLGSILARKRAEHALFERVKLAALSAAIAMAAAKHEDILDPCAAAIVENLHVRHAGLWLRVEGKQRLELGGLAGSGQDGAELRSQLQSGDAWVERTFSQQKPYFANGVLAFAGYPLVVGDECIGVLGILADHTLGEQVLDGLAVVASEIAAAIHQKQLERSKVSLEAQLRQAQKMEAIGTLAGGVAHDFNNVLSVILGYGEGLRDELAPLDPMREDVEEICRAGRRAADLTRQLLMFSRQQVVAPKVLDLNELLANMTKMLGRLLGADVELASLPGPALGPIRADWGSIEQVVMNLAVNARDAMPTGGRLTMETANVSLDEEYAREHLQSRPGPHVMLAITDTGTGMDKVTQSRIFEPFFTTKGQGKGTGLGLSTVFGIVRQCDGSVWVYSEPGVGTTFKIYFPRVEAALDQVKSSPSALTTAHGSETILLVEDDVQVRGVARIILAKHGYEVIVAQNAGEALLIAQQTERPIDLLLSDVVMPLMSGPELAKLIRVHRPGIKVLCMSGYTDDSIVRHGILDAQLPYLQKPITPETLTKKVRETLDMSLTPTKY